MKCVGNLWIYEYTINTIGFVERLDILDVCTIHGMMKEVIKVAAKPSFSPFAPIVVHQSFVRQAQQIAEGLPWASRISKVGLLSHARMAFSLLVIDQEGTTTVLGY